ncbi:MAG: sensor histidine kinase [Marinifilaceae bacterium]
MNSSYTKKLFLYFFIIFTFFTTIILMVQRNREHTYKEENLKNKMGAYTEVIRGVVRNLPDSLQSKMDSWMFSTVLPQELRVTVMDKEGQVLFDSEVAAEEDMDNHISRPEVRQAFIHGDGYKVRYSKTKRIDYFYYTTYKDNYFVRVAVPYDKAIQSSLQADDLFTYFILILFFVSLVAMLYFSDRFSNALTGLNEFVQSVQQKRPDYDKIKFPDTELGEISHRIVKLYKELEEQEEMVKLEREKLLQHFHYSNEGIAIFDSKGHKVYANRLFVQNVNVLLDEPTFDIRDLMDNALFKNFALFIAKQRKLPYNEKKSPMYMEKMNVNGKVLAVKLVMFEDSSYELILNDVSQPEHNRVLKQEMTNNIAHELRTPVSSIRGYMETLLLQADSLSMDRAKFFVEKAYNQTLRLTDLIRDIALITKMEEAPGLFAKEKVVLGDVVGEVTTELEGQIKQHNIKVRNNLPSTVVVEGNETLLFSVFRNLIENSIKYAGEDFTIGVDLYEEDEDYVYITYYDNGKGVEEQYLEKIFDRFYRVSEGRSRKTGGSGLGLSIVRNAVRFHDGTITAKPHRGRGLEFILSLKKK